MGTEPDDLIERLRAELDRLEAIAVATHESDGEGEWWTGENLGDPFDEADSAFIAEVGPAHVLRTIQAHRALLDEFEMLATDRRRLTDAAMHLQFSVMRRVVEALASIYFPESTG